MSGEFCALAEPRVDASSCVENVDLNENDDELDRTRLRGLYVATGLEDKLVNSMRAIARAFDTYEYEIF